MAILRVKTNASQATDVLIGDLGIEIPNSGGFVDLAQNEEIRTARRSNQLLALATDDAHGAGSSTLILNDGTDDVDQSEAQRFLQSPRFNFTPDNYTPAHPHLRAHLKGIDAALLGLVGSKVRVTRSANQSIPNDTNTNVTFPDEDFDLDGWHTGATGNLVVPAGLGGLYLCMAGIRYAAGSLRRLMIPTVNGTPILGSGGIRQESTSGGQWRGQIATTIQIAATDTVRLRTNQDSGGALNITNAHLELYRLGA